MEMRRNNPAGSSRSILLGGTFLALVAFVVANLATAAVEPPQGKGTTFFSQGQAAFDPGNREKSQKEAIQDFLAQAVTQAVASFLSPSQMGSQFAPLQEKILKQPERYVQSYQVFSEAPANTLYRITGQVTVSMDILKSDLQRFDLAGRNAPPPAAQAPSAPEPASPAVSTAPEASRQPARTTGSRGISLSKQELLWAVGERWGQGWALPRDSRDSRALFAMSVAQECLDYGWSLDFPEYGTLTVDAGGAVASDQTLALAKRQGLPKAVTGEISVQQKSGSGPVLEATLRVLDVASGRSQGEVHKEYPMGDQSNQEAAIELASLVVPQLDRMLRGTPAAQPSAPSSAPPAPSSGAAARPAGSTKGPGVWTLLIRADHQYGYWEQFERMLRERFKSMEVESVEMGPSEIRVQLNGVDGEVITSLQGTALRGGVQVQVDGFSPEGRSINLTLVPSATPSQAEPRQ